jgi:tetratricopeptide (TPR) repeat protein
MGNPDMTGSNPNDPFAGASDFDPNRPRSVFERLQYNNQANLSSFPSDGEPQAPAGTVSVAQLRNEPPKTELSLLQKAQHYANAGDHGTAIQVLKRGLAESGKMAHARGMLGTEYLKMGNVRAAIAQLKKAIELAPSVAANYSNLGYALFWIGDRENGECQVREALKLDKALAKAHYLLGLILLDRKAPEARDELRMAQNEVNIARLALAVYHEHRGETDEAEREIQAFLRVNPSADSRGTAMWVAAAALMDQPALAFGFPAPQSR